MDSKYRLKGLRIWWKSVRRFGFKKRCLVCGARLKRFDRRGTDSEATTTLNAVGMGKRLTICSLCRSFDRERLVFAYFESRLDLTRLRILHVAPERCLGRLLRFRSSLYVTGDIAPEKGTVRLDIERLPFVDGTFDLVVCNHVLEHVRDDLAAMREFLRVSKDGGLAILQAPFSPNLAKTIEDVDEPSREERKRRFGSYDHLRLYGADYPDRLKKAGWGVETIPADRVVANGRHDMLGIDSREFLFLCTKGVAVRREPLQDSAREISNA